MVTEIIQTKKEREREEAGKRRKEKKEGKNEGKNVKLSLFDNSVIVTKSKLALLTGQQAKKFTNRC